MRLFSPTRRERPLSLGIFPSSGGGSLLTPDPQARSETLNAENWRFADPSQPRSNTNLKVRQQQIPTELELIKKHDSENLKIGFNQRCVCFVAALSLDLFKDVDSFLVNG